QISGSQSMRSIQLRSDRNLEELARCYCATTNAGSRLRTVRSRIQTIYVSGSRAGGAVFETHRNRAFGVPPTRGRTWHTGRITAIRPVGIFNLYRLEALPHGLAGESMLARSRHFYGGLCWSTRFRRQLVDNRGHPRM